MPERTAVVTGASRGLGAHLALSLARQGFRTVTWARSAEGLQACADAAAAEGVTLYPEAVDVTDEDAVTEAFGRIASNHPPLAVCVNNAGTNYSHQLIGRRNGDRPSRPHPIDAWHETIQLCLTGTFLVGRSAAELMIEQGTEGVIVNISSAVSRGAFGQSAYSAAKAGVESLTRTWALELGDLGIRVVAVSPGVIDGDALRRRSASNPRHAAYMEALRSEVTLGRWTTSEDVASTVRLAVENRSMTGNILEVNCGGVPPRVRNV